MPRVAAFKVEPIAELYRQLRYTPDATRRRQMQAAERFVGEIDPQQAYPVEYIVYRITGYRPDTRDEPTTIPGEALLADLVKFIQRLSGTLKLPADCDDRRALSIDDVAQRLGVSVKTIQRYRRLGLVCHYITDPQTGEQTLMCFEDALQRFTEAHHGRVGRAADFTRLSNEQQQRILHDARQLREKHGRTRSQAARELAEKYDRGRETIRLLLQRHDQISNEPIFDSGRPLRRRDVQVIHRAARRGVPVRQLMQRFGKSRFTIYRAMNQARADVLKRNRPTYVHLSTFEHGEAEQVILSPAVVRQQLNDLLPMHDALTLIEAAHAASAVDHDLEQKLIAAFNFLKFRAARAIERMTEAPGAVELDRAETDLRWATLLKRRLVSLALPSVIRTIEQHLHHSIHHQTSSEITHYIVLAVEVAGRAAQQLDPPRGQRLERLAAYSMNRALAQMDLSADVKRAAARHETSGIPMHGVLEDIGPAPRDIQPWPAMRDVVDRLHAPDAHLMVMRYGWSGDAPRTIAELATIHEMTEAAMSRRLHEIETQLRTLARRNVAREEKVA